MSENLNIVNVMDIDMKDIVGTARGIKPLLAMKATKMFVEGNPEFESVNAELNRVAMLAGRPATMTYEDVIFQGGTHTDTSFPEMLGEIVVMSDDTDTAADEARFYSSHRNIEESLYRAIHGLGVEYGGLNPSQRKGALRRKIEGQKIRKATERHLGYDFNRDADPLGFVIHAVGLITDLRNNLGREQFTRLRPYFVGINGYPGPSGLYSASIPILDLLVHGGENMDEDERMAIKERLELGLYPDSHIYSRSTALLSDLLESEKPELPINEKVKEGISGQLNRFRATHKGSVRKFVPEAMEGSAGTGGVSDVASYLDSKKIPTMTRSAE